LLYIDLKRQLFRFKYNFLPKYYMHFVHLVLLLISCNAYAQILSGNVVASKNNEALPFVNVIQEGTDRGTLTDLNGAFKLNVSEIPCKLKISFVGYKPVRVNVRSLKKELQIKLKEDVVQLDEVVLTADYSFDKMMLKRVVDSKVYNNPDVIDSLNYSSYGRTSALLINVPKETLQKYKLLNFEDSLLIKQSDSTVMIPFYTDESLHNYYRLDNNQISELIYEKSDGVLTEVNHQIKKVLNENITTDYNFYNNQIYIVGKGFPSPISSVSSLYYKVYVTDSLTDADRKLYKFDFYPKSYRSTSFTGTFWVDSASWALTKFSASLPNTANLNFVSDFEVSIDYEQDQLLRWLPKNQKVNFKITLVKDGKKKVQRRSFMVQRVNLYEQIKPQSSEASILKTVQVDSLLTKHRLSAPLDSFELPAYRGIQGLKEEPMFRFLDKFSVMTLTGYYNMNRIDIGPYFGLYRKNAIEGDRISIPLRTSRKLSENFMLGGLIGYGFKNQKFAWNTYGAYKINSNNPSHVKFYHHKDYFDLTRNTFIEFIRENPYQQGNGNIFSTLMMKKANPFMLQNNKISLEYSQILNDSFGLLVRLSKQRYYSNDNIPFISNTSSFDTFNTHTMMVDLRYSQSQEYDEGFFSRTYYGNQKPVFHLTGLIGRYGLDGINQSDDYFHLNFSMKNRYNIGPSLIRLLVETGAIFGDVPFPLLNLTRGSRDFGSARYYFNLLHHASFLSDTYINSHLTINGGGVILDKFPGIKTLNLREVLVFKAFYGKLDENSSITQIPSYLQKPINEPYMELGFGITNIFKCLRIEYITRLNKKKLYDNFSSSGSLKFRLEVSF